MAEAFNSLFKGELIHNPLKGGRGWQSINDVEIAVAEYIDWYNHRRVHGRARPTLPSRGRGGVPDHALRSARRAHPGTVTDNEACTEPGAQHVDRWMIAGPG